MIPARAKRLICIALPCAIATVAEPVLAQTTVGTGSIVGTITDTSGAVVAGADVLIANMATGQHIKVGTNWSGSFNSGALLAATTKSRFPPKASSHQKLTYQLSLDGELTWAVAVTPS
jgi:hypothetical protein